MRVSVDLSALRGIAWHQYALRFVLGGLITAVTGLLAKHFGPAFAGLFLAFPAIFPASATLIAKREREKKKRAGMDGTQRGQRAAALDAAGAVLGSVGLIAFAVVVWKALPEHHPVAVFSAAGAVWLAVSISLWWLRKKHWLGSRRRNTPQITGPVR
jgi:uncharacterized membrane protein